MNSQELYERSVKLLQSPYKQHSTTWEAEAIKIVEAWTDLEYGRREYIYAELEGNEYNVNQSRLVTLANCKRKYYWIFELNLVPDRPQWALDVGKAAHEGLAALNEDKPLEEALRSTSKSFDASIGRLRLTQGEKLEAIEHRRKLLKLIEAYVEHWGLDEEYAWTVLKPEVQGRVEIGEETGCFLTFRTDAVVMWQRQLFLLEHKTMAQNRQDNWLKYQMDFQITAYVYALTKLLGTRIAGVIVNGLVKTATPQFGREMYTRTDRELQEFEEEFVEQIRELAWRKQRVANGEPFMRVFYKNTQECFRFGTCPYRTLCLRDSPAIREQFIQRPADYVDDPKLLSVRHDAKEKAVSDQSGGSASPRPDATPKHGDAAAEPAVPDDHPADIEGVVRPSRRLTWGDLG